MSVEQPSIEEIIEGFELLDDWEDRYRYLIDLGKHVQGLSEEEKTEEHRIHGCTSRVWLISELDGEGAEVKLRFRGDSDAHIVKGLVSVVLSAYSDLTPAQALEVDIEALFKKLGLESNLSVSRRNGFFAMIERVKSVAREASSSPA